MSTSHTFTIGPDLAIALAGSDSSNLIVKPISPFALALSLEELEMHEVLFTAYKTRENIRFREKRLRMSESDDGIRPKDQTPATVVKKSLPFDMTLTRDQMIFESKGCIAVREHWRLDLENDAANNSDEHRDDRKKRTIDRKKQAEAFLRDVWAWFSVETGPISPEEEEICERIQLMFYPEEILA